MGISLSASKRVKSSLSNSPLFDSACDSTYSHCLSLTQHAFPGVFPYQLSTAADHLHRTLSVVQPHPLILKWVPAPPSRSQVDSALRVVTLQPNDDSAGHELLGPAQFKAWAVELFGEVIVFNAGKAVLCRVPIGVAGIAGIGVVARARKDLVGTVIGVYSLGVATAVYLSLSG